MGNLVHVSGSNSLTPIDWAHARYWKVPGIGALPNRWLQTFHWSRGLPLPPKPIPEDLGVKDFSVRTQTSPIYHTLLDSCSILSFFLSSSRGSFGKSPRIFGATPKLFITNCMNLPLSSKYFGSKGLGGTSTFITRSQI